MSEVRVVRPRTGHSGSIDNKVLDSAGYSNEGHVLNATLVEVNSTGLIHDQEYWFSKRILI